MEKLKQSKYYKFYFNCKDIEDYKNLSNFFQEVEIITNGNDSEEDDTWNVFYPYYSINDDNDTIYYKYNIGYSKEYKDIHKILGYKKIDWKIFYRKYKLKQIK